MKLKIQKQEVQDPLVFLRRCGYGYLKDRRTGKESFVKRIHGDLYPRFHVHVEDRGESWNFNLHLDQRAPVYRGATAHGGDYDGPAVEKEADRIKSFLS